MDEYLCNILPALYVFIVMCTWVCVHVGVFVCRLLGPVSIYFQYGFLSLLFLIGFFKY